MKNQFFYTRRVNLPTKKDEEVKFREFQDSFNPEFAIRSVENEDGTVLVLLNDIHERMENNIPQLNKRGQVVGFTKQKNTFQSEITLLKEDAERFKKLTEL